MWDFDFAGKVMQMFSRGGAMLAAVVILTAGEVDDTDATPLFKAFKAFCANTDVNLRAVKAAVEAAGGKQYHAPASTNWPWPMTVASWDIGSGGARLLVSSGTLHAPQIRTQSQLDGNSCIVTGFVADDAGAKAIRKWVGVTPTRTSPGSLSIRYYGFQEMGGQRYPLPNDRAARRNVENEGRVWSLVLLQSSDGVSVQLSHHLPTTNTP